MKIFVVFLSFLIVISAKSVKKRRASSVIELTDDSYRKELATGRVFVRFYASWCSDCETFTPSWKQVADQLKNSVTVADIDCAKYKEVCKAFEIKNFPTFVWVEDGEVLESLPNEMMVKELISYAKRKTSQRLKREVTETVNSENLPDNITEIHGKDFESTIGSGCTLVTFCVPWCSFCKRTLTTMLKLQSHFSDIQNFKIVTCDCNKNENADICFAELSNGVPMINLYCNGKLSVSDYHGSSYEELEDMIKSNIGDKSEEQRWILRERERKKNRKEEKNQIKQQ